VPATIVLAAALLLMVLPTAALAAAAEARPLREVRSANSGFVLRIDFGRASTRNPVPCRATLYGQDPNGRIEQRWEAVLANDVAPSRAFVRDDGAVVVTLDEYRRGGARCPLVVYGPDGTLLRHFLLTDLLGDEDWPHVMVEGNAVRWLEGATVGFSADGAQFDVRLASGRALSVDLTTLDLVGRASGAEAVPPDVRALLEPGGSASATGRPPAPPVVETTTQPTRVSDVVPHPSTTQPADYAAWLQVHGRGTGLAALPLYVQASERLTPWSGAPGVYDALRAGDETPLGDPNVGQWLTANAEALRLYRDASQRHWLGAEYARAGGEDLTSGLVARLGAIRELGHVALLQALHSAATGDPNAAIEWRLTVARTGAQLCRGGSLLEDLTGLSLASAAYEDLLRELSSPRAARLDYAELAKRLDALDDAPAPFAAVVRGEQALAYDTLQRRGLASSSQPAASQPDGATSRPADPFDPMDACYDAIAAIVRLPYPQARQHFGMLEEELSAGARDAGLALVAAKFERSVFLRARTDTLRRGVRLLVLIRAYQQQNGRLPETLTELSDDRWLEEPLSGKQFVYRLRGGDCMLYSVGADGVDDGGVHHSAGERLDYVIWPRPR
jgi:hypothetical protein